MTSSPSLHAKDGTPLTAEQEALVWEMSAARDAALDALLTLVYGPDSLRTLIRDSLVLAVGFGAVLASLITLLGQQTELDLRATVIWTAVGLAGAALAWRQVLADYPPLIREVRRHRQRERELLAQLPPLPIRGFWRHYGDERFGSWVIPVVMASVLLTIALVSALGGAVDG